MEEILVSIHCITYNHEKYISDAIDSFLMQKTDFKYEILIHDDASTDRTAEIILEYEKAYPNLIKPIYQTENQYSRGIPFEDFNFNRAEGKYIAFCEGDDFWTDPYKLQKQVDYMESHPECSLCVHAGKIVTALGKNIISYNRPHRGSKLFGVSEIIEGGGGLFLTNSMLCLTGFIKNSPTFVKKAPVSDYPTVINLSLLGKVYYMDGFMSCYRVGDNESWTNRIYSDIEKRKQHYDEITEMLNEINLYTNYKYDEVIAKTIFQNRLSILLEERKFKEIKTGQNKAYYIRLGLKRKLIILLTQYYPNLLEILKSAKRKLVR